MRNARRPEISRKEEFEAAWPRSPVPVRNLIGASVAVASRWV